MHGSGPFVTSEVSGGNPVELAGDAVVEGSALHLNEGVMEEEDNYQLVAVNVVRLVKFPKTLPVVLG